MNKDWEIFVNDRRLGILVRNGYDRARVKDAPAQPMQCNRHNGLEFRDTTAPRPLRRLVHADWEDCVIP